MHTLTSSATVPSISPLSLGPTRSDENDDDKRIVATIEVSWKLERAENFSKGVYVEAELAHRLPFDTFSDICRLVEERMREYVCDEHSRVNTKGRNNALDHWTFILGLTHVPIVVSYMIRQNHISTTQSWKRPGLRSECLLLTATKFESSTTQETRRKSGVHVTFDKRGERVRVGQTLQFCTQNSSVFETRTVRPVHALLCTTKIQRDVWWVWWVNRLRSSCIHKQRWERYDENDRKRRNVVRFFEHTSDLPIAKDPSRLVHSRARVHCVPRSPIPL